VIEVSDDNGRWSQLSCNGMLRRSGKTNARLRKGSCCDPHPKKEGNTNVLVFAEGTHVQKINIKERKIFVLVIAALTLWEKILILCYATHAKIDNLKDCRMASLRIA
jgi:hypothetical protein